METLAASPFRNQILSFDRKITSTSEWRRIVVALPHITYLTDFILSSSRLRSKIPVADIEMWTRIVTQNEYKRQR